MNTFLDIHQDEILGTLSCFDRMIIRGHLTGLFPTGAFGRFLSSQDVLLKDFAPYVEAASGQLKAHAKQIAADAGRPYVYLESATTKAQGQSKEDRARTMAAQEGITEGLVVVFAVLENCQSFEVRKNHETGKLEAQRCWRKCLHFYFYSMDREFGLMHVRLQSWFPFDMQVYVNGHEWLARQLDKKGIAYQRYDNSFTQIDDLKLAQQLCDKFARRKWPRVLDALARQVNPLLKTVQAAGFKGYYWSLYQCEYSTDVLFRDRATLEQWLPAWYELTLTAFSAEDVLRFLGRKLHGNFQGEVCSDLKRRREGRRAKHRVKRNSLKLYDKASVLRIETTINNPREFKVLRVIETPQGRQRQWRPMNKGVANLWRYAQVSAQANARYLEALAQAQPKGKAMAELDRLCQPRRVDGKRYARFQPFSAEDCQMFAAVLDGKHALNGFRNKDLQARLYDAPAATPEEVRRRSQCVSRKIAKLRGHGLVKKVPGARLYRPTECGTRLMAAALHCRNKEFPGAVLQSK
jgi:hypothetical protein